MQLFLSNNERRIARRIEETYEEDDELLNPDELDRLQDLWTEEEKEERERREEELLNMSPDFVKEIMSILTKDGYSSNNTIELGKLAEIVANVTTLDDLEKAKSAENAEMQLVSENDGASQGGE